MSMKNTILFVTLVFVSLAGGFLTTIVESKDVKKTPVHPAPVTKVLPSEPIAIIRRAHMGSTFFFLRFTGKASISAPYSGVRLLLANGTRMDWPNEEMEEKYVKHGVVTGSVILTDQQITTLSQVPIASVRMDLLDMKLSQKQGQQFQKHISRVTDMNDSSLKE